MQEFYHYNGSLCTEFIEDSVGESKGAATLDQWCSST